MSEHMLMTDDLKLGHITAGLTGILVGIALGLVIASLTGNTVDLISLISPLINTIVAPAIIAILGAYASADFRIRRQWEKEQEAEKTQWKVQTVSLLQRISLECKYLNGDEPLQDREFPTSVYQYNNTGPLSHLDTLFEELMEHYSKAPAGIGEEWQVAIARLKRAYDDPGTHPDISTESGFIPSDTKYFKLRLGPQVEEVLGRLGESTDGVDSEQLPLYTADPKD
jgi:hypothetical protein